MMGQAKLPREATMFRETYSRFRANATAGRTLPT